MAVSSLFLVAMFLRSGVRPEDVPQNATVLVTDWELSISPVSLISALAPEFLGTYETELADWAVTDKIVEADVINVPLLKRVARAEGVVEAFENTRGKLHNPAVKKWSDPAEEPLEIRRLLKEDTDSGREGLTVSERGFPVLLGMIIEAITIRGGFTYHAQEAWLRGRERHGEREAGEPNA